ncbi:MAG: radical SAM protein [Clostridia bacterium]|nr:radical SAM protein [Clostridia bacterium]
MGILNKLAAWLDTKRGVKHCTFNPKGPGVVRIHLIPPRFSLLQSPPYIVILNGYYLLPLGPSWALLLSVFIDEVNAFAGKPIDDADRDAICERVIARVSKAFPVVRREALREDLLDMTEILFAIARGEETDVQIDKMSLRTYAPFMRAPHRMDLMVSAMTDAEGHWQCNQKCMFCYAAGEQLGKTKELSREEWCEIIDKLRRAGVPMLTFTGGEPTGRDDLAELIAHAKWFVTRLNTNGRLLTPALVAQLTDAELDNVQITLYAADADIHNKLVGGAYHHETVAGIKAALAGGLDVSVNTPLCRLNADYVSTLGFLHGLGVRFVTVSGLICTGGATTAHAQYDLSEAELAAVLRDAKEFCDANGMEMDFTSPGLVSAEVLQEIGLRAPACGAALSNMAIAPDGTVVPCQSWLSREGALGHMLTDDFDTVWGHSLAKRLRAMDDEQAKDCPFRGRTI